MARIIKASALPYVPGFVHRARGATLSIRTLQALGKNRLFKNDFSVLKKSEPLLMSGSVNRLVTLMTCLVFFLASCHLFKSAADAQVLGAGGAMLNFSGKPNVGAA